MKKADTKKLKADLKAIENLPIDWYSKMCREKEEAEELARKTEASRIAKIKCPSCKSTSKEHVQKRDDNGIIGPGYSSWLIDEYFVCNKCGTMFKDMEKRKNLIRKK